MKSYIYRNTCLEDDYGEVLTEEYPELFKDKEKNMDVISQLYYDMDKIAWDDFTINFSRLLNEAEWWLMRGTVGFWLGSSPGGMLVQDLKTIMRPFKDCDYIEVFEDEDGHLHFEGTHHDGKNSYIIYKVSEAGMNWLNENYDVNNMIPGNKEIHDCLLQEETYLEPARYLSFQ